MYICDDIITNKDFLLEHPVFVIMLFQYDVIRNRQYVSKKVDVFFVEKLCSRI